MVPHKLSAIWFSPILPVLFFRFSGDGGPGDVDRGIDAQFKVLLRHGLKRDLLRGVGKGLSWVILLYLAIRGVDLVMHGVGAELLTFTPQSVAFWIEILIGLLLPLAVLLTPEFAASERGLFWGGVDGSVGSDDSPDECGSNRN